MKKILLASASKDFLKRNTTLLLNRGSHVFTALSGAEALRQHEEYCFDLILSDHKLMEMDGTTFCWQLRQEGKSADVPVILVCRAIPGSLQRAEQSGATIALVKPIDPGLLIENIGRFIGFMMRGSKRVAIKTDVSVRIAAGEFPAVSQDISTTGILLEAEHELALGSSVSCRFSLPGSYEIEAAGEVVRFISTLEMKNFYGVKFTNLSLPYWREIDSYVAAATQAAGDNVVKGSSHDA